MALFTKDFVSLDIETTDFSYNTGGRIIQIGAVKYLNDQQIDTFCQYVNPDDATNFAEFINNISNDQLVNQPDISQVKEPLLQFVDGLPIIGHNIKCFDLPFLRAEGIEFPNNNVIDTLTLCRHAFGNKGNRLVQVEERFSIPNSQQHDGLNDALATAKIYQILRDKYPEQIKPHRHKSHIYHHSNCKLSIKAIKNEVSKIDDALDGARFVCTGTSEKPKKEIYAEIVEHGGNPTSDVTSKTDYLIVGQQNIASVKDKKHKRSNKMTKAMELGIPLISLSYAEQMMKG